MPWFRTYSSAGRTSARARSLAIGPALMVSLLAGAAERGVAAQVSLTQEEALRLAFPEPATIERRTAYLDEAQLDAARRLAGGDVEIRQSIVTYYVGAAGDTALGVAYFDAHRVRTLPEVLMIVVSADGRIERVEILKFSEPPEYRAPDSWLRQLEGKAVADELALKKGIVNMTGATLTSRAIARAAKRVLALHEVVRPLERWRAEGEGGGSDGAR